MSQNFDARRRMLQPEMMDAVDADPQQLVDAFVALARINRWSRTAAALWPPLWNLSTSLKHRPLVLGDIGCGDADVSIQLCRWAQRQGAVWSIIGYDLNPLAIELAEEKAAQAGIGFTGSSANVAQGPPLETCDAMLSSLFLHHLGVPEVQSVLARMAAAAEHLVLVSDLKRSRLGYFLAQLACNVLTRSEMARVDGPRSVAGAFRIEEVAEICSAAGLAEAKISSSWPERYLLQWRRA